MQFTEKLILQLNFVFVRRDNLADFSFFKGSDYTVFAEGVAVGGIKKIICVA